MWYQLQIEQCKRDEVDQLSEALEETGALSITLTDNKDTPVLEPEPGTTPLWPEVTINALYTAQDDAERALLTIANLYDHLCLSIHKLDDEDWERVWMDDFKPQRFGRRLWICPSWLEPPESQAVNLILDPGLAFGTGTHPTTSLCLTWLDQADLHNKTIIDYGCGSGILALAAIKLGALSAEAIDIDEQALQATQNNALANTISSEQLKIHFPQALVTPADLLIANILLGPLIELRDQFKKLIKQDGLLVVSGILEDQAASLIDAYQTDFIWQSTDNQEGWSLLAFKPR